MQTVSLLNLYVTQISRVSAIQRLCQTTNALAFYSCARFPGFSGFFQRYFLLVLFAEMCFLFVSSYTTKYLIEYALISLSLHKRRFTFLITCARSTEILFFSRTKSHLTVMTTVSSLRKLTLSGQPYNI